MCCGYKKTMKIENQKLWIYRAIAVFITVVLVELVLQSFSLVHGYLRRHSVGEVYNDHAKVILCIGESTTGFGLNRSYPALLQKKLNRIYGPGAYRVINEGWPGTNSGRIAAKLDEMMQAYRPDAVISMLGVNDVWGLVEESFWDQLRLVKIWRWITGRMELAPRISMLSEIKTDVPGPSKDSQAEYAAYHAFRNHDFSEAERRYKLLESSGQMTGNNLWFMAITKLNLGGLQEAKEYFERFATENERSERHWLVAGYIYEYYTEEEKDFIIRHLQRALELEPTHLQARWLLGLMYRNTGKSEEAETEFLQVLESRPCDATVVHSLWKLYTANNQRKQAVELADRCASSMEAQGTVSPAALSENRPSVVEFMRYRPMQNNYKRIAKIIRDYKALHVAMQYPLHKVDKLRDILKNEPDILFVSNHENFEKLLKQYRRDEVFTDNFALIFGHSTELGNQAIADEIISALTSQGFLPSSALQNKTSDQAN